LSISLETDIGIAATGVTAPTSQHQPVYLLSRSLLAQTLLLRYKTPKQEPHYRQILMTAMPYHNS